MGKRKKITILACVFVLFSEDRGYEKNRNY